MTYKTDQKCSIPDCRSVIGYGAKGMCGKHYQRFITHGDATLSLRRDKGTGTITAYGYRQFGSNGRMVFEHVLKAEKVLGRLLRGTEEVHHFNEIKTDNRNENLIICPDYAYHALLHIRQRAFAGCGDPNKRKCRYCKNYDFLHNLVAHGREFMHAICRNKRQREYIATRKHQQREDEIARTFRTTQDWK